MSLSEIALHSQEPEFGSLRVNNIEPFSCIFSEFLPKGSLINLLQSSEEISNEIQFKIINGIASGMWVKKNYLFLFF